MLIIQRARICSHCVHLLLLPCDSLINCMFMVTLLLHLVREFTQKECPGNGKKDCCNCAEEAHCSTNSIAAYTNITDQTFGSCEKKEWHGCCHDGVFANPNSERAYYIELGLHWGSVTILLIFLTQLVTLLCLYGKLFCRNIFYVIDLGIILVSLILEITITEVGRYIAAGSVSNVSAAGSISNVFTAMIAIVLGWRVVRIIHGLYGHKEKRGAQQQIWKLEVLKRFHNRIHNTMMLLTAVRHGATSFKDNPMIANQGLSDADATAIKACRAGNPPSVEELEAVLTRRQEFRHKYEEFLNEMSKSLENVHSQMCAHEKILKQEIHDAEHHNHATSFNHGHGHGHGDHGHGGNSKKVHPVDDTAH